MSAPNAERNPTCPLVDRAENDNKRNIATEVIGAVRSLGNKAPCLTLVSQNHKDRGVI